MTVPEHISVVYVEDDERLGRLTQRPTEDGSSCRPSPAAGPVPPSCSRGPGPFLAVPRETTMRAPRDSSSHASTGMDAWCCPGAQRYKDPRDRQVGPGALPPEVLESAPAERGGRSR